MNETQAQTISFTDDQKIALKRIHEFGTLKNGQYEICISRFVTQLPDREEFKSHSDYLEALATSFEETGKELIELGGTQIESGFYNDMEFKNYSFDEKLVQLGTTHQPVEVGTKLTFCFYTDTHPYEVIAVSKSGKTATVREMSSELDPSWKPECHIGGFCAHTSNNYSQKWIIKSDPNGRTAKIRLCKEGWKSNMCGRVNIGYASKFHDYNF